MDLKSLLNKEQYEAATTIDGQVLILAGAGSGKTRVLTHRIAYMIENDIKPYNILAITFTNKAAGEMRERVKSLVGEVANNMWISTFHSSCVRILRREIDKLGYSKDFTIYDSSDQKTLIKLVMRELNINEKEITDLEILGTIGKAKDNIQSAQSFKKENEDNFRKNKIADAYLLYQKKLKENNALDFDDLIVKTVELFRKHNDVLEFYQNKFKYIMIDEYQDTNKAQYEFAKLLAAKHKNICVVGDDDQCIYAWRGADIRNILDFEKDYPEAKVVKLEQNYRSKGNILEAANKVIKNNAERKDILAYLKIIVNPKDSISLRRIINVPKRSIGDTTVEKLQNHATEIDDTLYNVLLDVDYVPGLTARSINPIKKFTDMMEEIMVMSEQLSVSQLIEYVLEKTGYLKSLKDSKLIEDQSRIENLEELVSDAVEFEKSNEEDKSLSAYLEKVALVQDMDDLEAEDNYVMLMTVHSSKGLEFPTVFLVGMENGIFPNAACFEHDNQMEEARRLCYVGITRAEEKLYMTSAETRMIFGKTVAYGQSDFISEIPANIKDYVNINGKSSSNSFKNTSQTYGETRKTYNPHSIRGGMSVSKANESLNKTLSGKSSGNAGIDELTMGRKVKHPKFGVGTLITKSKVGDDYKLTIAFDSQGVKHLMFSFAPLELL